MMANSEKDEIIKKIGLGRVEAASDPPFVILNRGVQIGSSTIANKQEAREECTYRRFHGVDSLSVAG
jgi:hypothetical protein